MVSPRLDFAINQLSVLSRCFDIMFYLWRFLATTSTKLTSTNLTVNSFSLFSLHFLDLPVHHVWKAWSPFGAPRNIRIQLTDDFPFEAFRDQLDSNLRFEEPGVGIHKGDRIILLNGKRIRSKERLREKIAEEVDFIATENGSFNNFELNILSFWESDKVIDRGSENVFKDLELDIKEDQGMKTLLKLTFFQMLWKSILW